MNTKLKQFPFIAGILTAFTFPALAETNLPKTGFITAPNRADIAYDTRHEVLYISGESSLLRYDMRAQKFIAPIQLGGTTMGMDISPDGNTLAVANSSRGATKNFVDLINLDNGSASRVAFNLAFSEGGTFTVAYDKQSKLLVSSEFEGSGWVPLRKYDPVTKSTTTLGDVTQDTMLAASADHSVIAIAESNISNGPWGTYHTGEASYTSQHETNWFNSEIGVSRDGSQVSIPTYGGTFVDDPNLVLPAVGEYAGIAPIGVAYSPVSDLVYFPMAQTNTIGVYDTNTMLELDKITVQGQFDWTGNGAFVEGRAKIASDNSYLFSTLDNGVYFSAITPVPEPSSWVMMILGCALIFSLRSSAYKSYLRRTYLMFTGSIVCQKIYMYLQTMESSRWSWNWRLHFKPKRISITC